MENYGGPSLQMSLPKLKIYPIASLLVKEMIPANKGDPHITFCLILAYSQNSRYKN